MKELTAHERAIRDQDTKDLTLSELKEKIRIVNKEATQFDKDLLELNRKIHSVFTKRNKRIAYAATLKSDYNQRCHVLKPPLNGTV